MRFMRSITPYLSLLAVLWLCGCSGTIQRDTHSGSRRIEGAIYQNVEVVLSEPARKLQGDNPQFSIRELGDHVRRRLDSLDLVQPEGRYRVEVTVEEFRVRSALTAVMLGVMAGADSIDGYVRVFDQNNRPVHGFKVKASYALGGLAGGQDSTRMGWLYDKFAELAVAELAGTTQASDLKKKPRAAPVAASAKARDPQAATADAPAAPPAPARPRFHARTVPAPSGYATAENVDAVPVRAEGRERYAHYLTLPSPKAFAVYDNGGWRFWSNSADAMANVLDYCARQGRKCWLYAVDDKVVWREDMQQRIGRTDQLQPNP